MKKYGHLIDHLHLILEEQNPKEKESDKKDSKKDNNSKEKNVIDISNPSQTYKKCLERLAYLQFLINDKSNKENKKELQTIYDTLKDLSFDKKGELRTIEGIIKHIKYLQKENNGRIPNLPSDKILKSIDTKMIRFKDYDSDTLNKYVSKIQKELSMELSKSETKSDSEQILKGDPAKESNNKDIKKELKTELEIAEDSNKGLCRALCLIDLASGLSVDKSDIPDEVDLDSNVDVKGEEPVVKSEDDALKDLDDDQKKVVKIVYNTTKAYIENYPGKTYDEKDIDEWLKAANVLNAFKDEEYKNNFVKLLKSSIKKELEAKYSLKECLLLSLKNNIFEAKDNSDMKDRVKNVSGSIWDGIKTVGNLALGATALLLSGPIGLGLFAFSLFKRKEESGKEESEKDDKKENKKDDKKEKNNKANTEDNTEDTEDNTEDNTEDTTNPAEEKTNKEDLEKAYNDAKKAYDDASKEVEDLKTELNGMEDKESQEYKDLQNKITEKETSLKDLKTKMDDAEKAKNKGGKDPKEDLEKAYNDAKKAHDDAAKEVEDLKTELNGMEDKESQEYKDLQNKITEKETALKDLKTKMDDAEKAKNKGGGEPNGEPNGEELTDDDIKNIQDEIAELDPENDKDKIKELNDKLKKAAKANGKPENEYEVKIDTDEGGNPRQRKVGPQGGKYYRVKTDGKWGPWNSDSSESLSVRLKRLLYS